MDRIKEDLITATANGNLQDAQNLVANNPDLKINYLNLQGMSPLWAAACNGHYDVVVYLRSIGGDINLLDKVIRKYMSPTYLPLSN